MTKIANQLCLASILLFSSCQGRINNTDNKHIRVYDQNNFYWQYKGQPVLLLGGSNDDNLFQWTNDRLISHLDSMITIGANYVRNTMGAPPYNGFEVQIYKQLESGKYDLNQWNEEYWQRFENLLKHTAERNIIVQVEIWDRFDHSRKSWLTNPYNPKNNINYTMEESGLDTIYSLSATKNAQPFFFSVPALKNNRLLLKYQNEFVEKLLSFSLNYDHVLYCLDNETTAEEEWAVYWAEFIQSNSQGKDIYITEMWGGRDVKSNPIHMRTVDHPERYRYIELNAASQRTGRLNWDNIQYYFDYIRENPRPVNDVKLYGHDGQWQSLGLDSQHAVETFCRYVIGGFAAIRFHRLPGGLGLSPTSAKAIQTIRKIEEEVKMWEINPRMDLLQAENDNLAYLATDEGEKYLVYFPKGDKIDMKPLRPDKTHQIKWISTKDAEWGKSELVKATQTITLDPELNESCFALITIKK